MTTPAAKARTARYLSRHRAAGGKLVCVRMDAEQLARADALRLPDESRSACINRMLWIMSQPKEAAEQRCAELEKDASRYQWLRDNCVRTIGEEPDASYELRFMFNTIFREDLDTAIDAALAESSAPSPAPVSANNKKEKI